MPIARNHKRRPYRLAAAVVAVCLAALSGVLVWLAVLKERGSFDAVTVGMTAGEIECVFSEPYFDRTTTFSSDEARANGIPVPETEREIVLTVKSYHCGNGRTCDVAYGREGRAVLKWNLSPVPRESLLDRLQRLLP